MMHCLESPWARLASLIGLLGTASLAVAELTVIFDNGQAMPMTEFLGPLAASAVEHDPPAVNKPQLGAADPQSLLPIRSLGLTPGKVKTRAHKVPFARPFFLIGSDARSKRWLVQHRQALKAMAAVGLLVEATSIEDLQEIAALADGLPITPASGTDLAKAMGIAHYPVAITAKRIWQ